MRRTTHPGLLASFSALLLVACGGEAERVSFTVVLTGAAGEATSTLHGLADPGASRFDPGIMLWGRQDEDSGGLELRVDVAGPFASLPIRRDASAVRLDILRDDGDDVPPTQSASSAEVEIRERGELVVAGGGSFEATFSGGEISALRGTWEVDTLLPAAPPGGRDSGRPGDPDPTGPTGPTSPTGPTGGTGSDTDTNDGSAAAGCSCDPDDGGDDGDDGGGDDDGTFDPTGAEGDSDTSSDDDSDSDSSSGCDCEGDDGGDQGDDDADQTTALRTTPRRGARVCRPSTFEIFGQMLPLVGAYVFTRRKRR